MTKNSKLKEIVLSAARRFFSKFLQSDLKGNRDRRGCSVWRDLERCNERCFVWASATSLHSVTWWIYNRHQGTSEVYRRWLQIIRWTCNGTRGGNSCFLSGTSNFAARGQCVRGHPTDRFGKLSFQNAQSPLIFLREFSPRTSVVWEI